MIRSDGQIILLDLGFATIEGSVLMPGGTDRYSPPELNKGRSTQYTRNRDIYAIGITIMEIIVSKGVDHSEVLEDFVLRCLQPDMKGRITPAELLEVRFKRLLYARQS